MSFVVSRRRALGFTLVELLVVLAILGLLAGIVGPKVMKFFSSSKTKTAKLQIEELVNAVDLFDLDVNRYPTASEGLAALINKPSDAGNWNGPYLKKQQIPKDPWGQDYHYAQPGSDNRPFDIYSFGSDSKEGGDGEAQDVLSWN